MVLLSGADFLSRNYLFCFTDPKRIKLLLVIIPHGTEIYEHIVNDLCNNCLLCSRPFAVVKIATATCCCRTKASSEPNSYLQN